MILICWLGIISTVSLWRRRKAKPWYLYGKITTKIWHGQIFGAK